MLCSLNEYVIVPALISHINSRSECEILDEYGKLPLFAAPMSSVIDETNYKVFERVGVNTVIPRTVDFEKRISLMTQVFCAFSLDEFEKYFLEIDRTEERFKVCVDVANGHMERLISLCSTAKDKYRNRLILMTGNIANPKTYSVYARANIDYIRVGIGSGNVCFPAGTKITMADGKRKSIENILPNDYVHTKNGSFKVTSVHQKQTDQLLKINKSVSCTPDHKFYVVDKDKAMFVTEETLGEYGYWVRAKDLCKEKHLLVKCFI